MKKSSLINLVCTICAVLSFLVFTSMIHPLPACAAPFYQGKTVEIIVPFAAGGGADIGARYLQQWLPKFVPGKPRFVVVNKPGASGSIGANYVYNVAKPDGLTLMQTSGAVNLLSSLQLKGVEFNLAKMPMVIANSLSTMVIVTAGVVKNFKDI